MAARPSFTPVPDRCVHLLSAHTWTVIGICAGFVAGMAVVFRFLCPEEPRGDEPAELEDGDPGDMLAAA